MSKIVIIENDHAFVKELTKFIHKELHEPDELVVFHDLSEFEAGVVSRGFFDDVSLALVDLELGPSSRDLPTDLEGRDVILPALRNRASWVPCILVSRYVPAILAAVTPFGFDAVLSKQWFSTEPNYRKEWINLRRCALLHRNAARTGRGVSELQQLLTQSVALEYGAGLEPIVSTIGHDRLLELLKLLNLGGEKVILDELVMGYSGLSVVKATSELRGRGTAWLVKFGIPTRKLTEELKCHRQVFTNGLTRRLVVPPFWWSPLHWEGFGIIAYEFEPNSEPLLAAVKRDLGAAFEAIRPALGELYRETTFTQIIPRKVLSGNYDRLSSLPVGSSYGGPVDALRTGKADSVLDTSLQITAGCQHGDFHARNVLLSSKGPTFIDFAHYRSAEQGGCPLLDLLKLLVDCWAFGGLPCSAGDLLSGEVLNVPSVSPMVPLFTASKSPLLPEEEKKFFGLAARCCLALYSSYPDVPTDKKTEAMKALLA